MLRLAEALSAPSGGASARSVLRLEDLIEARSSLEDAGMASVELLEGQARLLMPIQPVRVEQLARRGVEAVVGVDSSSRHLETPPADIVVGSVSAVAWGGWGAEWPSVSGVDALPGVKPPFIYVLPNYPGVDVSVPGASTVNPAGRPFDEDYSVHQALDEMRVSLENWMLSALSQLLGRGSAVLLDGPVFLVAKAVLGSVPSKYSESWRALLESRLGALSSLESRGVAVVGVVKRVERSRLMSQAAGLERLLAQCGVGGGSAGDRAIIDAALRRGCFKWRPGSVLRTPKLAVSLGEAGVKVVEYLVVPAGGYQLSTATARVYRLEYTEGTLEDLRSVGLEPAHVFLADSVARGSLEPVTIAASDWRSSRVSRGLRRALAAALRSRGVSISYSSMVEVEADWAG